MIDIDYELLILTMYTSTNKHIVAICVQTLHLFVMISMTF